MKYLKTSGERIDVILFYTEPEIFKVEDRLNLLLCSVRHERY